MVPLPIKSLSPSWRTLAAALAGLVAGCSAPAPGTDPIPVESVLDGARDALRLARKWNDPERYRKTEALLETVLAAAPERFEAHLALALLMSSAEGGPGAEVATPERSARALAAFEAALQLEPENRLAHHALALHHEIDAQDQAVAHLAEVARLDPDDTRAHYKLTKSFYLADRPEQARASAIRSIALAQAEGNHFEVQEAKHILGRLQMEEGDFDGAEALLKDAIVNADGSHWACAYQALGELYSRIRKEPDVADGAPEPNESETPDQAYAASLDAYESGNVEAAVRHLDRALALEPRRSFQVTRGLFLLLLKRYDEAEALFVRAHEEAPDDPGPKVGLGHLGILHQDYGEARHHLEAALEYWFATDIATATEPGYLHIIHEMGCLGMGWVFANRGRHKEALPYFDKVLHHRPDNLLGLLGRANSLIAVRELDKAKQAVSAVLAIDDTNPYALAARATIALHRGNDAGAEQDFLAALVPDGTNYTCPYEGLGLLYLRQGRTDEAKTHFEKAIAINPDIEFKKYNGLARIYIDEGRYADARRLLEKSVSNFPEDGEAAALLRDLENRPR